jgi:hypothetical protein
VWAITSATWWKRCSSSTSSENQLGSRNSKQAAGGQPVERARQPRDVGLHARRQLPQDRAELREAASGAIAS